MKKRHQEWLKLTTGKTTTATTSQPAVRVIDLPGFQKMEDKLRINPPVRDTLCAEVEFFADLLSKNTFGITRNDTLFEDPPGYDDLPLWSEERWAIDDRFNEHEDRFQTEEATDDEAMVILMTLGFDFRDENGFPLRCTKLFSRQAEAASKGIMGRLPDYEAAKLESWAKKMEREVEQRIRRKRSA